LRQNDVLRG